MHGWNASIDRPICRLQMMMGYNACMGCLALEEIGVMPVQTIHTYFFRKKREDLVVGIVRTARKQFVM